MLGVPRIVVVDDFLTTRTDRRGENNQVHVKLTSKNPEKDEYAQLQIWPAILEKSVAKMMGNYYHLVAGAPAHGISMLLGAPWTDIVHEDVNFFNVG